MRLVYFYFIMTLFNTSLQAKVWNNFAKKHDVKIVKAQCNQNSFLNPVVFYDSTSKIYHICNTSKKYSQSEIEKYLNLAIKKATGQVFSRKVASIPNNTSAHFNLKVTYGDKVSQFKLTKDKDIQLQFISNYGDKKFITIDETDYKYLQQKISQLKPPQINVRDCNQKHITLASIDKNKRRYYAACFDYSKSESKELIKLSKIIFALQQI